MTKAITALSADKDSTTAGAALGRELRERLNGAAPDAIVVFASAQHDYDKLLSALAGEAGTRTIVGSSSAGEFTHHTHGQGFASALGLRSDSMTFAVGAGRNLSRDPAQAAREVAAGFSALSGRAMPYRAALVMADALAGQTESVIEELTMLTGGNYRFFGGGAGDDGRFSRTHVFAGTEAITDAIVALEIGSMQPIGVGVAHGWVPAGRGLRVTEVDGNRLVSLNGLPAVQAFEEHAAATGQQFDAQEPLPFFLHNILGIAAAGDYRLRVPLALGEDGAILCAAAIPQGSIVHIMKTSNESAVLAAERATRAAIDALAGRPPAAALVFDCVATRLRLGRAFENELKVCADLLQPAGFVGCNTYGQIARAEGQFGGFHNCTAVVGILPE